YYQNEFSPYVMNITRMDAHGGWIASSKDLAKLLVRINKNSIKPDILPANLLNQLYFSYTNWYHFGSLPGTSTIMHKMDHEYSFIVLANTRTHSNGNIILDDLNTTLSAQINNVTIWPTVDLF